MSDMRTLRAEPEESPEAHPEAAALLAAAGWTPHPKWGVYTRGTLVMGGDLLGGFHVKDWGLDLHGPDTPDTAEEAAAWLVQRFALPADVVTLDYKPEPAEAPEPIVDNIAEEREAGQDAAHETVRSDDRDGDAETPVWPGDYAPEDASGAEIVLGEHVAECPEHDDGGDAAAAMGVDEGSAASVQQSSDVTDADYTLPEIELIPPDPDPSFGSELLDWEGELAAEPEDDQAARDAAFIFGDNLDQKRTAAIGLVVQIALQKMPAITVADDARLAELRNFTLGVSEGRWANDPGKQAELEGLELIASLARQVEAARDAKVALLVSATREQIEAFDPLSDWP